MMITTTMLVSLTIISTKNNRISTIDGDSSSYFAAARNCRKTMQSLRVWSRRRLVQYTDLTGR